MMTWPFPENLTRFPWELGRSPSAASSSPALASSWLYWPILVSSSVLGRAPASDSLLAFTMTMTRIVFLHLYSLELDFCLSSSHSFVERGLSKSTIPVLTRASRRFRGRDGLRPCPSGRPEFCRQCRGLR